MNSIPQIPRRDRCPKCKRRIQWAELPTGTELELEVNPDREGVRFHLYPRPKGEGIPYAIRDKQGLGFPRHADRCQPLTGPADPVQSKLFKRGDRE